MKKLFTLSFLVACLIGWGQNLVPNPSFEVYDTCPTGISQISKAVGWYSARPSPDYFPLCSGVPDNYFGHQYPASGNAYAGFAAIYGGVANMREYIGATLNDSLLVGTRYYISFKVSRAYKASFLNDCSVNKIGALFSTIYYSDSNYAPVCNCSQVYTDVIISDSLNWTIIKGSFIADSSYRYINIGNFFTNAFTDSIQTEGTFCNAYYYLDDVCVSTDSLTCNTTVGIQEPKQNTEVSLFPNPFTNQLSFEVSANEPATVTLYDMLSRQVMQKTFTATTTLHTAPLATGIYIYQLQNSKGVIKKGKVVRQ